MNYPKTIVIFGKTMQAIGIGKYPYNCIAKDKFPDAMIYKSESGSWIDSASVVFTDRNKEQDSN